MSETGSTPEPASAGTPIASVAHFVGGGVFAPGRRALTAGITLGVSVVGFEALGVSTAMPVVSKVLHGESLYGWSFSVFMLGQLIGIVTAGADADARGPRRAYFLGLVAFAIGLGVSGAANSMELVVAGRFVAGTGAGAVLLLAWSLIGRCYPEDVRPRMLAVASSAWVLPGLIGPAIAGWVADHLSWRWVFLGLIAPIVAVAMLILPALHLGGEGTLDAAPVGERFWDVSRSRRSAAGVVLAIGMALVVGGLDTEAVWGLVALVAAGVAVIWSAGPALFPSGTLSARPGLPAVVASYALLLGAFVGAEAFLPYALDRLHQVSASEAGLILTCGTTTWTVGSWVQARNPERWRRARPRLAAGLLLLSGIAAALTLTFSDVPVWCGYAGWTLGGIGMGIAFNSVSDETFRVVSEDRIGRASSATQLAGALASAFTTGVNGAIVNAVQRGGGSAAAGVRAVFGFQLVVAAGACIVGLRVRSETARDRT